MALHFAGAYSPIGFTKGNTTGTFRGKFLAGDPGSLPGV